jgi:hypothetical protein
MRVALSRPWRDGWPGAAAFRRHGLLSLGLLVLHNFPPFRLLLLRTTVWKTFKFGNGEGL